MASTHPNFSAEFSKTYNSFSGVDIHAVFGGSTVLEIQGISFTISREKAPIYTMGRADPRAFSRGKRGIAGSKSPGWSFLRIGPRLSKRQT